MYTFFALVSLSIILYYVPGISTAEKPILRYGFQNTQECPDYEKAFICIQKCQDLNYDTAASDKDCKCRCYMKPEIAKYKIKSNTTRDNWKLGAPTSKLPIWAQTTNADDDKYAPDDDDHNTEEDSHENTENGTDVITNDTEIHSNNGTDVKTNDTEIDTNNGTDVITNDTEIHSNNGTDVKTNDTEIDTNNGTGVKTNDTKIETNNQTDGNSGGNPHGDNPSAS